MKDAFEQLMHEADKPTQVPERIAKYVDALVKGTHEITSVTIRPKRTWVGLTDEDIWSEYQTLWPFHPAEEPRLAKDIAMFVRAIEAKLREKNT